MQVNPARAPEVVGALLDAEAPDDFVNNLILSVRSLIPVERLCAEVEKRNRLKLLSPFLEHLVSEGSQVRTLPAVVAAAVQALQFMNNVCIYVCCFCCEIHGVAASLDRLLSDFCRTRTCTTRWARSSSTRRTTRTTS